VEFVKVVPPPASPRAEPPDSSATTTTASSEQALGSSASAATTVSSSTIATTTASSSNSSRPTPLQQALKHDPDAECSICCELLRRTRKKRLFTCTNWRCKKWDHEACVRSWYRVQRKCMHCRTKIGSGRYKRFLARAERLESRQPNAEARSS
jgi:hypothetical protein